MSAAMPTGKRWAWASPLVLAILCLVPRPARAQLADSRPGEARPVVAIDVQAPRELRQPARAAVATRIGSPLDLAELQRSIQNIYALGRVSDVQVSSEQTPGGVRLRFNVLPAAVLDDIRFAGASPVGRSELRDALTATRGDRISRALLDEQAARVQGVLSDHGYLGAVVEPELILHDDGLAGTFVLHLEPGAQTRLARLELVGDLGLSETAVRTALELQEGGPFRYDTLGESVDRLRRRLAEARYFHADIQIADQAFNQGENTADLVLRVDAGPRVELNLRGWDRSEEELRQMLPFYEEASVADWILNQARTDIIAELQRQGYWKPLVSFGRVRDAQGRNVVVNFTVAPVRRTEVSTVEISGNDAFADNVLLGLLQTHRHGPLRGDPFLGETWVQDQRAVLGHYRRNGYLQARIVEAPVTFEEELGGLRAAMIIDEGAQTVVNGVSLDVLDNALDDYGVATGPWFAELLTRDGGPYDPDAVRQDETRLRILLANEGFARAQVLSNIVEDSDDPYTVSVGFTVYPGRRTRVGQLLISGNEGVSEEVIRRELTLVPGSPYTQESVIVSQSRLYRLGIFSRVQIDTAVPNSIAPEPTVVVRVTEGPSRRLSWGLGYSTEEQARGLLVLGEDNLWNRNHRATVSLRASFAEQRLRFIYTDPYLLGRALEGSAVGYYESIDEEGFKLQRIGASLQVVKRHSTVLTGIARYSFRNQQTYDVLIDESELQPEDTSAVVGSLIYSLIADTRPDPIDPRRGSYNTIDTEWASHALGSQSDFLKVFGRSYWYLDLPGDSVFVAAARAGLAVPYGGSIVPLPERFFAGGSTSLRGFGRNRAGPTDVNGNPLGGNVLMIGNLEYRFPVRGDLGAVLFTDVGNVFSRPHAVALDQVRETVGIGVRYATPIGPLRLDWGYLLDARPGEDTSRFHFAIGQAF